MTSLSESQAFLDQFDKCLPLCERGDAVTVINALHTLNSITQASISQATELKEGRDFVCSFLLELELALELYISPSRKLGTIDGGLPALYSCTEEQVSALAKVPSHATKAKVRKFLDALGVAPSPEFQTRTVADTVSDFLRVQVDKSKMHGVSRVKSMSVSSKRSISWADQCSSGSGSDSDTDSCPLLEDEEEIEGSVGSSCPTLEEEEECDEKSDSVDDGDRIARDAAAAIFLSAAPILVQNHDSGSYIVDDMDAHYHNHDKHRSSTRKPDVPFYKTRMCKNWQMHGSCQYMDKCNFAHGEADLRTADTAMSAFSAAQNLRREGEENSSKNNSQNYKTRMCLNYEREGFCKYGDKCAFAHGQHELRRHRASQDQLC